MDCTCGTEMIVFAVGDYREHAPGDPVALCPRCLALTAAPDSTAAADPDFDRLLGSFPRGEGAVPLAVAVGLLDSLALNRRSIVALIEAAERAGADPLLTLDRLGGSDSVDPDFDVRERREQLEAFLE
ncbi:MAG: DUF6276 family protein [Natronomonas sp.]